MKVDREELRVVDRALVRVDLRRITVLRRGSRALIRDPLIIREVGVRGYDMLARAPDRAYHILAGASYILDGGRPLPVGTPPRLDLSLICVRNLTPPQESSARVYQKCYTRRILSV